MLFSRCVCVSARRLRLADASLCAGVLFICMNVDYRVLFTPLTDEVVRDAFEFYTTFFHAPPAIKVCVSLPHRD